MLYGSLYKVFKQLSKKKDKDGKNNQYDEIIIPKLFLKILLNDGKIPKIKKPSKNNNKTSCKDDIITINNFINEEIDNISPKMNPYFNFQKKKERGVTPLVKSHYINNPNLSLPKIKFKKKIPIITKKLEDIKNTDKQDFIISEAILKQMKKTYYQSPYNKNKGSFRIKNSLNLIKKQINDNNIDGTWNRRNSSNNINVKIENDIENKKLLYKMEEGNKNNEKNKDKNKEIDIVEDKNKQSFNKINIISNNNNLILSKNKSINSNNEIINKVNNYSSLKNKSTSRLINFLKEKQSLNQDIYEKDSIENNSSNFKINFEFNKNNNNNNFLFNYENKLNNNIKIKRNIYNSSHLFKIKPRIKFDSRTFNFYSVSITKNFKDKHNTLDYINRILNKNIIDFPLNTNISSKNEIFHFRINKMYRNQFIQYMSHRLNWENIDTNNTLNSEPKFVNFEWRYYSNKLNYKNYKYDSSLPLKKLKIVNLFEKNYEIGNKKNMFINLINYCDKSNINVFDIVPFTIIVNNSQYIEETLDIIQALMEFVETNKHFKGNLVSNKKYNELFWYDKNYELLTNQYVNINKNFISTKNYWIIKPTDLYQGKCIEISNSYEEIVKKCRKIFKGVDKKLNPTQMITNNIDELKNIDKLLTMDNAIMDDKKNFGGGIKKKIINSRMYCSNEIIIQKYLDNPLLYQKRKFDIRCFVLVDCNMNLFFCREGHLKGSSESYNLNNTNKFIHITNHSLQKKSNKFEMYELGNEMSYQDFKNFMRSENISLEKFDDMINQMKLLIKISFKSVANKLLKTSPVLCFEIFGYDFILDNDFKLWILEINNNPGLGISSPLIEKLVPRMLDDAFRLTIDKIFNTIYSKECIDENGNYKSKYKLEGFSDEENIFEFLCNIS